MLVINVADDRLDQVFQGHQAVGAAELVDHQSHVGAGGLHLQQQIGGAHGGWHIERVPADPVEKGFVGLWTGAIG